MHKKHIIIEIPNRCEHAMVGKRKMPSLKTNM